MASLDVEQGGAAAAAAAAGTSRRSRRSSRILRWRLWRIPSSQPRPPRPSSRFHLQNDHNISFPKRIPNLESIYAANPENNFHRLTFEDLIRQQEASERKLARKQGSLSSARADLYQILGLFFVFQGVVLTAVSQTNLLRCHNWYLPFLLSLFVSIFTFAAALQKLLEASDFQEQCRLEKALYNALSKSIDVLREEGLAADKEKCVPDLPALYTESELRGRRQFIVTIKQIFYVWLMSYAGAVLLLIVAFSTLTLISVRSVLCQSGNDALAAPPAQ